MESGIIIKKLISLDDIKNMAELETAVWGMDPIPFHQTYTAVKNGGLILGAFDDEMMVGFSYSFPGYQNGSIYLCSHMMGIRQANRDQGIGKLLKDRQRVEAQKQGYSLITWTFDPLESVNGYLNLHKLHGLGYEYEENVYGEMGDVLNTGLPTDRFKIHWYINKAFTEDGHEDIIDLSLDKMKRLIETDQSKDGLPILNNQWNDLDLANLKTCVVPIPRDYQSIKKRDMPLARDWRIKTRVIFRKLIQSGFVAVDLRLDNKQPNVSYYLFAKKEWLHLSRLNGQ